jgi:SAM-dependent methyltransferase
MIPFVRVSSEFSQDDMEGVKKFYNESTAQPFTFQGPPPLYATMIAELIASLKPSAVLEFGCNAGRVLALIKRRLPGARLVGMDLNRTAIEAGRRKFGLDLRVADETSLASIPDSSFDVTFTVSVLDHIAMPQQTAVHLARITRKFVIVYEICHDKIGKIEEMQDAEGKVVEGYPFSYFHDYRRLFTDAGCWLLLDAAVPGFVGNLGEFYRLQVYARQDVDFGGTILQRISASGSLSTAGRRGMNRLRKHGSHLKGLLSRNSDSR